MIKRNSKKIGLSTFLCLFLVSSLEASAKSPMRIFDLDKEKKRETEEEKFSEEIKEKRRKVYEKYLVKNHYNQIRVKLIDLNDKIKPLVHQRNQKEISQQDINQRDLLVKQINEIREEGMKESLIKFPFLKKEKYRGWKLEKKVNKVPEEISVQSRKDLEELEEMEKSFLKKKEAFDEEVKKMEEGHNQRLKEIKEEAESEIPSESEELRLLKQERALLLKQTKELSNDPWECNLNSLYTLTHSP